MSQRFEAVCACGPVTSFGHATAFQSVALFPGGRYGAFTLLTDLDILGIDFEQGKRYRVVIEEVVTEASP